MNLSEHDVVAVIDARGGGAYVGSLETGLVNRCPDANSKDRRRVVKRAVATGLVVLTPMGLYRRAPRTATPKSPAADHAPLISTFASADVV